MKISKQVVGLILIIGISAPIVFKLYYLSKFGVDMPTCDQWDFIPLLKAYYSHENWLPLLFNQVYEHRPVFPKLICLVLAQLTNWNVKAEMLFSWVVSILNLLLLWGILRQTKINIKWLLIPLSILLFSISQWETTLWSLWSLFWHLMIFGVLSSIYFLTKISSSGWYILPAVLCGIIASFSVNNGLLIWPIGLMQLLFTPIVTPVTSSGKKIRLLVFWGIMGAGVFALYYFNYTNPSMHPSVCNPFYKPIEFSLYILANLGAGIGAGKLILSVIMGIVVLIIFISSFFLIRQINKFQVCQFLPWFSVGLFSILSSAAISMGRVSDGIRQSLVSRYITASSLLIIATIVLYISVLKGVRDILRTKKIFIVVNAVLFIVITIGFVMALIRGWKRGESAYLMKTNLLVYLHQFEYVSDDTLTAFSFSSEIEPSELRKRMRFLKEKKLSVFRKEEDINLSDYKEAKLNKEYILGYIDKAIIPSRQNTGTLCDVLNISGWAIDPINKKSPRAIFILMDGKILGRAFAGIPRHDIAHQFKNNDLLTSGWEFFGPAPQNITGLHKITARIIFWGKDNYYKDITKEVNF